MPPSLSRRGQGARLGPGHTATSPTLLHLRLARLRRALVAVAEQE